MSKPEYSHDGTFAALPRTTRGMPLVLGGSPDGKTLLYCNGTSVIMRDVHEPRVADVYTEHSQLTTVAKYAPSGFYVASADQSGKVRVWDTTQREHLLKAEFPVISGAVRDIAWSADSKRIAVVGDGRERFGHVFLFDTGTSNGNLSGQSKAMNSIDFRPTRPFRLVSASEDTTVALFEGPPFKFKTLFHHHCQFVQCVRYQPTTGALFASGAADGKVFLYGGDEGELKGAFVDSAPECKGQAHTGGVYGLSWTDDGRQVLTASGDKTCKLWDVETMSVVSTFKFGAKIDDQQLSCLCLGGHLLSVSLSGHINYLDANNPGKPLRILTGHNKPITALTASNSGAFVFSADFEGNTTRWHTGSGDSERVTPKPHENQVAALSLADEQASLVSVGWDDAAAFSHSVLSDQLGTASPASVQLPSQPRGVSTSADGRMTVVACQRELSVFVGEQLSTSSPLDFEPNCVALRADKQMIAVGGQDSKVHVYAVGDGGEGLRPVKEMTHVGPVNAVAWSADGQLLAAADSARRVVPYRAADDFAVASSKEWTFHTAKVNCLAWCPDGRHLASGGLDTNVIVWDVLQSGEHPIIIKGAHAMSQITGVVWLDEKRLLSAGQDANLKLWSIFY